MPEIRIVLLKNVENLIVIVGFQNFNVKNNC